VVWVQKETTQLNSKLLEVITEVKVPKLDCDESGITDNEDEEESYEMIDFSNE
jgi:hypothetical protein